MPMRFLTTIFLLLFMPPPQHAFADYVQKGIEPSGASLSTPRFTENSDNTLTDQLTGLIWPKEGTAPTVGGCTGGTKNWDEALEYVKCLNLNLYLGHDDWRLPTIKELRSLINQAKDNSANWLNGQGFRSIHASEYWTSDSYDSIKGYAWIVGLCKGETDCSKVEFHYHVVPVRNHFVRQL